MASEASASGRTAADVVRLLRRRTDDPVLPATVELDAALDVDLARWARLRRITTEEARSDVRRHAIELLTADPSLRRAGVKVEWWC